MAYEEEEFAVKGDERDLLDHVLAAREHLLSAAAAEATIGLGAAVRVGRGRGHAVGGLRARRVGRGGKGDAEREESAALDGGAESAHGRVDEHWRREAQLAAVEVQRHLRQAVQLCTVHSFIIT